MSAVVVAGLRVALDRVPILHGVDLRVAPGEWVTVIGPNGAGKSTLLRAVGGLLPATGSVRLFGVELARMSRRARARRVATVTQSPVVPPGMTVFDYVLLGRTPYLPPLGRESAADLAVAHRVLARLGLSTLAGRQLATLSGGERQRVFLARALAQEAPLLLLDEPTTALDLGRQQQALDLVDRLRRADGLTVVTTLHDMNLAARYADTLLLLARGRAVAEGTPAEVLTEDLIATHFGAVVKVVTAPDGRPAVHLLRERP